jgi:GAF domain-containing protein
MLASQAAVALDNAQWSQGLEQKVAQRTEELQASKAVIEQRANELAIINSIQEGMAAELHFQAIVDLVGDKLREVFATRTSASSGTREDQPRPLPLRLRARQTAHGAGPAARPNGSFETIRGRARRRSSTTTNGWADYRSGTDTSKSMIDVPIISGDRVLGTISIENYEREDAFGEADVRLLSTVAGSMGVALENAACSTRRSAS